jgi:hypothetical protein
MTNQQIADHLHEALNGLSIGWMMANVRDNAKRAELQQPIEAAQASIRALLDHFDPDMKAA